jgi:hypothetical protein
VPQFALIWNEDVPVVHIPTSKPISVLNEEALKGQCHVMVVKMDQYFRPKLGFVQPFFSLKIDRFKATE